MAAIRVAQLARSIVIFGEEESSVIPLCRVFVKQLIHRPQKPLWLFPSGRALAAQSCLEVRHEQSSSDALAHDICYYQAESSIAEIKKVVIVSTDAPRGMARPRIDKRSNRRLALGKQTGLDLLGNCQVVCSLPLRLQLGSLGAPLCFQRLCRLVELN